MSVSEQSAAAKQNAIGSEPPRPALALDVTMLLCGSLAAAGSIALLVLAILRTLAAANTAVTPTDQLVCSHVSGGTSAAYTVNTFPGAGSAVVAVRNNTAASLSEAIVLRCSVIKSVDA